MSALTQEEMATACGEAKKAIDLKYRNLRALLNARMKFQRARLDERQAVELQEAYKKLADKR